MASSSVRVGSQASSAARRTRRVASWVRRWYGANPLHLLALLAAFALAGYAVHAVMAAGEWTGFAEWFAVAIIAHDLLLFPLYSLADLSLRHLLPGGSHGHLPGGGHGRLPGDGRGRLLSGRPSRLPTAKPATRGPFQWFQPGREPPSPTGPTGRTAVTLQSAPAQQVPPQQVPAQQAALQVPPQQVPAQQAALQPPAVAPTWPPLLNYVRIPVIFSLLLLMTFFPMILGLSEPEMHRASGLGTGPYVWRWLGVTGVMFAISAGCYAVKTRRLARRTVP